MRCHTGVMASCQPLLHSERYSNSNWREKIFETMFFEAWRLRKRLQMIVFIAAIVSDKFSSKSELSSRFFGRLKFFALFEYLSLTLSVIDQPSVSKTRAVHSRPSAHYRSNRTDYRIDRIELDKKSKFFRFGFLAFFRPPSVVQS